MVVFLQLIITHSLNQISRKSCFTWDEVNHPMYLVNCLRSACDILTCKRVTWRRLCHVAPNGAYLAKRVLDPLKARLPFPINAIEQSSCLPAASSTNTTKAHLQPFSSGCARYTNDRRLAYLLIRVLLLRLRPLPYPTVASQLHFVRLAPRAVASTARPCTTAYQSHAYRSLANGLRGRQVAPCTLGTTFCRSVIIPPRLVAALPRTMAPPSKQSTLGYVKPSQTTLGHVFR